MTADEQRLVTVLTTVRNGSRYLAETIASVRSQTLTDWEMVIVDDASEDDSARIVERAAESDVRIRLLRREEAGGAYVAANDGLSVARGRYIARLDADDLSSPDRLERQAAYLASKPHLRACGGFHQLMTERGEVQDEVYGYAQLPGVIRWRLCLLGGPAHSTAFVERRAFAEIGGYGSGRIAEDRRMWSQLARRNWLGVAPAVVLYRRLHGESVTSRHPEEQLRRSLAVAKEHLNALTADPWTDDDVFALWEIAVQRSKSISPYLPRLDRWARSFRTDPSLTQEERRQLEWLSRRLRWNVVRTNWRRQPIVGTATAVRAAAAEPKPALRRLLRRTQPSKG